MFLGNTRARLRGLGKSNELYLLKPADDIRRTASSSQPQTNVPTLTRPDSPHPLQRDLDDWLHEYNFERTHQGKICYGRTPMQTLINGKEAWHDKVTTLIN